MFQEGICFRTGKRIFELLLLDAAEKWDLPAGRFRMVNGAGLRVVALRLECRVIWNGLSLDDATFKISGLCMSVSAR